MRHYLSELHAAHETARNIFDNTANPDARNELAQCLSTTGMLIPLLEAGEPVDAEFEADILLALECAREKVEKALGMLDEVPDTLRSEDISLTK